MPEHPVLSDRGTRSPLDELEVMRETYERLAGLDPVARIRVMRWLMATLDIDAGKTPRKSAGDRMQRKNGTGAPILQVMVDGQERTAPMVHEALAQLGIERREHAVVQALSYLTQTGRLSRVRQGVYVIADSLCASAEGTR